MSRFLILVRTLRPNEHRIHERYVTLGRMSEHEASALVAHMRDAIEHHNVTLVEGPVVVRERVSDQGVTSDIANIVAIVATPVVPPKQITLMEARS